MLAIYRVDNRKVKRLSYWLLVLNSIKWLSIFCPTAKSQFNTILKSKRII